MPYDSQKAFTNWYYWQGYMRMNCFLQPSCLPHIEFHQYLQYFLSVRWKIWSHCFHLHPSLGYKLGRFFACFLAVCIFTAVISSLFLLFNMVWFIWNSDIIIITCLLYMWSILSPSCLLAFYRWLCSCMPVTHSIGGSFPSVTHGYQCTDSSGVVSLTLADQGKHSCSWCTCHACFSTEASSGNAGIPVTAIRPGERRHTFDIVRPRSLFRQE